MREYINEFLHRLYVRRVMRKLPVTNRPVAWQRRHLDGIVAKASDPKNVSISEVRTKVSGQPPVDAEWVLPEGCDKTKVLLYFHGGGFIVGSKESHRSMVSHIAKVAGVQALSINYRLAPENCYPAANLDCLNAYLWLLDQGYLPNQISVGGDSAGGFFVLQTLLAIKAKNITQPKAAFLISPLADALYFDGDTYVSKKNQDPWLKAKEIPRLVELYLGPGNVRPKSLSPINMDLSGLPPVLIHVGEDEILLSDALRLHQQFQKCGVEADIEIWPNMWHVFHFMGGSLPKAKQAVVKLGNFLRSKYTTQQMGA